MRGPLNVPVSIKSFEPYTRRYLKLIGLEDERIAEHLWLREYPDSSRAGAHFAASDGRFKRLFAAGREPFRKNSFDIFMDCPSREHAGLVVRQLHHGAHRLRPLRGYPH